MPPAGTVTYRFPDITKSLRSKDFSDPLTSIARRRGSDYINKSTSIRDCPFGCGPVDIGHVPKEDVGFEPTHAFTRLTVFKTVPFNQTWVILQIINQNQYLALGAGPPRFRYNQSYLTATK